MKMNVFDKFNLTEKFVKEIFIISFFLCLYIEAFSQLSNPNVINRANEIATREAKFTLNYNDVNGSPYYTSDFVKSVAYLKDGNFASIPLRYDIFRDEIEFMNGNKISWLKKNDVKFVRYGSEMMILTHAVTDTSQLGYFFLNSTGNYKLLTKRIVEYNPEVPAKGYSETVPANFKRQRDEFYIQLEGKPALKVKTNKDLNAIFANNQLALDYIKKEKIKVSKSQSIQNLIDYLNKK